MKRTVTWIQYCGWCDRPIGGEGREECVKKRKAHEQEHRDREKAAREKEGRK